MSFDVGDGETDGDGDSDGDGVAILSALLAARQGEVVVEPEHRKKWVYKQLRPFFPLHKNDIRRNFALMWTNVWNWGEPERYREFLRTYTSKFCVNKNFNDSSVQQSIEDNVPFNVAESSFETSVQNYAHILSISDDAACTLQSCRVVRSKVSRAAKIFMKFRICGTKLYDIVMPRCVGEKLLVDKVDGSAPLPSTDLRELYTYRAPCANPVLLDSVSVMVAEIDEFTMVVTSLICRCIFLSSTPVSTPFSS